MRVQASFLLLIWSIADLLCTVEVRGTCSITKEKKETGYKSYHPFEGLKKSKKTGWAVEVAEDARIDELDGTFYSGLIPRFSRPGRNKQDVVIVGEVRVAFLDAPAGVVLHRPIAGCWCVIGHDDARAFAEVVQDFDVAGNPVVHCPELARV